MDNQSESDLDEDNIIHSVDTQPQKKKSRDRRKQSKKTINDDMMDEKEMKYNSNNEDRTRGRRSSSNNKTIGGMSNSLEFDDIDSLSVASIGSPGKNKQRGNTSKHDRNRMRQTRTKGKSKKSQNRNRNRNQFAFYATLTAAAIVIVGLAKFYYQTHQGDNGGSNGDPKTAPAIDFRKKPSP